MKASFLLCITLTLIAFSALSGISHAAPKLKLIAKGLDRPVWATAPKYSKNYLYLVEKSGRILVQNRKTNQILPQPFLDIRNRIKIRMNEQGLLCMAFCPHFNKTGRFYLNYTNLKGDTEIVRMRCNPKNPTRANIATSERLLLIKQDSKNHNGGWLGFGPDNYLYIGMGDGGSANDPKNRAQDLSNHLGSLLRIDVSGASGYKIPKSNPFRTFPNIKPEIYAFGLRNPWRCTWDRKTKDFYIADLGQNHWEEINFVPRGKGRAANYGWRKREGLQPNPKRKVSGQRPKHNIDPIYTYSHGGGKNQGLSITGGFVYRGKIKSMQGRYFFADWINPRIWSITVKKGRATDFQDWTERFQLRKHQLTNISSFAQDPQGELYIISHRGMIYKIVP